MNAPWTFSALAGHRLHLGVCGSVAAYKMLDVLRWWQGTGIHVSATLTPAAQEFVRPRCFEALGAAPVYDQFFGKESSPFAHLEPGQVAEALCIAPASAASIARLAQGQADSLLACQALAFDGPLVLAPAMNPRMWQHPATQANVALLQGRGAQIVPPACGSTACGDEGQGKLADVRAVYAAGLRALLSRSQDMQGLRVMVTLGPTRESWDAVRHWSNPSTGTMGAALAMAAWLRGAEVDAICGPCGLSESTTDSGLWLPAGIRRHPVQSAADMYAAARDLWPHMDVGLFTAAVADFSPRPFGDRKFKKADAAAGFSVEFTPNVDILQTLAAECSPRQKVVGFAAEKVADLAQAARIKLQSKRAHMIVANPLGCAGAGFGAPTNAVVVVDVHGREEQWPLCSKADVAWKVCSWLLTL